MNGIRALTFPGLSHLRSLYRANGSGYLVAWGQRISGVLLVVYVLVHINTLSSLANPEEFARKAQMFSSPAAVFAEWLLAVPVIFHCLNGGRLLIYELFTTRFDRQLLYWVYVLSFTYLGVLGYLMALGNQRVSSHLFWLLSLTGTVFVCYLVYRQVSRVHGSPGWKLHRLSAAALFLLVPAHMLFMHLNSQVGRDATVITERMNQPLIMIVDGLLLVCILYHGGYGLVGIVKDYCGNVRLVRIASVVAAIALLLFGLQGIVLMASV